MGLRSPVRVFLCEEQPVIVEALARILPESGDLVLDGVAASITATVLELTHRTVDVLLVGQPPSSRSVLPILTSLGDVPRSVPTVVWVSDIGEVDIFRSLRLGARGILRRTDPVATVLQCLRIVGSGELWMGEAQTERAAPRSASARITTRERQVIGYVCRGLRNHEIAHAMSIAPGTVKVHLMHIFEKTGLRDRFSLAEHGRKFLMAELTDAAPE